MKREDSYEVAERMMDRGKAAIQSGAGLIVAECVGSDKVARAERKVKMKVLRTRLKRTATTMHFKPIQEYVQHLVRDEPASESSPGG